MKNNNHQRVSQNEILNVVLMGNAGVGKSSFANGITSNTLNFSELYSPTMDVEFFVKRIQHNNKSVCLKIWDLAGAACSQNWVSSYIQDGKMIFLFYDVTEDVSLEKSLSNQIAEINTHSHEDCIKILVGNKSREKNSVESIAKEEANTFVLKHGFHTACRISVKDGRNIDQPIELALNYKAFLKAVTKKLESYENNSPKFFGLVEQNQNRTGAVGKVEKLINAYKKNEKTTQEVVAELTKLRHDTLQDHQKSFAGYCGLTSSRLASIIQQTINDFANRKLCSFEELREYQKNYQDSLLSNEGSKISFDQN